MSNKITIEQAKQQITEGFSSIMTREDVLHLLDCLEVNSSVSFNEDDLNSLSADITNDIVDLGTNMIDDYELSMNGREVELDSVSYNEHDIQDAVLEALKHYIKTEING